MILADIFISLFLFGDNMERQQLLKFMIPIFTIIAMGILSEVMSKYAVHDYLLIKILLWVSFLYGFLTYWIIVKLGIN